MKGLLIAYENSELLSALDMELLVARESETSALSSPTQNKGTGAAVHGAPAKLPVAMILDVQTGLNYVPSPRLPDQAAAWTTQAIAEFVAAFERGDLNPTDLSSVDENAGIEQFDTTNRVLLDKEDRGEAQECESQWFSAMTTDGRIYYYNRAGETTWEQPAETCLAGPVGTSGGVKTSEKPHQSSELDPVQQRQQNPLNNTASFVAADSLQTVSHAKEESLHESILLLRESTTFDEKIVDEMFGQDLEYCVFVCDGSGLVATDQQNRLLLEAIDSLARMVSHALLPPLRWVVVSVSNSEAVSMLDLEALCDGLQPTMARARTYSLAQDEFLGSLGVVVDLSSTHETHDILKILHAVLPSTSNCETEHAHSESQRPTFTEAIMQQQPADESHRKAFSVVHDFVDSTKVVTEDVVSGILSDDVRDCVFVCVSDTGTNTQEFIIAEAVKLAAYMAITNPDNEYVTNRVHSTQWFVVRGDNTDAVSVLELESTCRAATASIAQARFYDLDTDAFVDVSLQVDHQKANDEQIRLLANILLENVRLLRDQMSEAAAVEGE